jgi:hypothetical protein
VGYAVRLLPALAVRSYECANKTDRIDVAGLLAGRLIISPSPPSRAWILDTGPRSMRATEFKAASPAALSPPRKPLIAAMCVVFDPSSLPCLRLMDGSLVPSMRFAPAFHEIGAPSQIFLACEQVFDATPEPSGSDRAFQICDVGPKSVDAASKR